MLQRLENDATDDFSGHTLMLRTHGLVDRSTETLNLRLLNAPTVNVNGEITPIVAAKMIMDDPRYQYLTPAEFQAIQANLKAKSRCYGYVHGDCPRHAVFAHSADLFV